MKKLLALTLVLSMTALVGCGGEEESGSIPVIGISQYGQHASLDNCREGILLGLEEGGLVEGEDFTVEYQNAGFDDSLATQIAQNFSAQNVDLMVGIATPSATAAYAAAEDKDIPVVFTAISDPVQAKLDSGNITGTSDKLPVEAQLELIRALQPEAETIGILYTTSEPNSISTIAEYEAKAGDFGFTIETIGVTQQSEVLLATDNMIAKGVDVISNLTDNNVVGVLPSILEKTSDAGIPVYGSEVEQVKLGCVAAAGIDYIGLGKQTSAMVAKIITGEATADQIPYEVISSFETYLNIEALESMNIVVPKEIQTDAILVD